MTKEAYLEGKEKAEPVRHQVWFFFCFFLFVLFLIFFIKPDTHPWRRTKVGEEKKSVAPPAQEDASFFSFFL